MPLYDYEDEIFDGKGRQAKRVPTTKRARGGRFKRFVSLIWRVIRILLLVFVIIYMLPLVMSFIKGVLGTEPDWMKTYFVIMQQTQNVISNLVNSIGK